MFRILGWLGFLPFIALLIAAVVPVFSDKGMIVFLFVCYSAIILSFLSGSYWERARQLSSDHGGLLASNIFALLAALGLIVSILSHVMSLVVLACSFIALLALELKSSVDIKHSDYRVMRVQITSAVVICHFLMTFISWNG